MDMQATQCTEYLLDTYRCPFSSCQVLYENKLYLKIHIKTQHSGEIRATCKVCKETFVNESILETHFNWCKQPESFETLLNALIEPTQSTDKSQVQAEFMSNFTEMIGVQKKVKKEKFKPHSRNFSQVPLHAMFDSNGGIKPFREEMQGNNYVSEDHISLSNSYEFNKEDGLKIKDSHNKTIETENHLFSNDQFAVIAKVNKSCTKETGKELPLNEDVKESLITNSINLNVKKVDIEVLAEEVVQEFRDYENWCRLNAVYLQSSVGATNASISTEGSDKAIQDKEESRIQPYNSLKRVEDKVSSDYIIEDDAAESLENTVLVSTETKDFTFSFIEEVAIPMKLESPSGNKMPQQMQQVKCVACETCGQRIKDKKNLNRHMKTHLKTIFECKFCGRVLKSQIHLDRHLLVTHSEQMDVKQILLPTTTRGLPLCFSWTRGQCGADSCPRAFRHYYIEGEAAQGREEEGENLLSIKS